MIKPPAIMYKHDVDSYHDIDYYDYPLRGLTYVDNYLYMFEWDWDSHRYLLVRLGWFEARMQLLRRWLFITLVSNTVRKPRWIRSIGFFLWYQVINRTIFRRV